MQTVFVSVKLRKKTKNCADIFEGSSENFKDGGLLGTVGNSKHGNRC